MNAGIRGHRATATTQASASRMTHPLASAVSSQRQQEAPAKGGDRRATFLLSAGVFFLAFAGHVIVAAREALFVLGGEPPYRAVTTWAAALLGAAAVPLYAWALRRSQRAAVSRVVSLFTIAVAVATFVLYLVGIGSGAPCTFSLAAGSFAAMHLWAVACDVDRPTALRRLPWMAVAASLGLFTANALTPSLLDSVGIGGATLLVACLGVAQAGALVAHEARDPGTAPAAHVPTVSTPQGHVSAVRSSHAWLLVSLNLVFAVPQTCVKELQLFPDTPRWPGPTILVAGTVALLLIAVPFLRKTQAPLVALWTGAVVVAAAAVLLGASTAALTALDVVLAATAPVAVVAREALLLALPRQQRMAARAAMWFWVWPIGELAGAMVGVIAALGSPAVLAPVTIVAALLAAALAFAAGAKQPAERSRPQASPPRFSAPSA